MRFNTYLVVNVYYWGTWNELSLLYDLLSKSVTMNASKRFINPPLKNWRINTVQKAFITTGLLRLLKWSRQEHVGRSLTRGIIHLQHIPLHYVLYKVSHNISHPSQILICKQLISHIIVITRNKLQCIL